MRSYRGPSLVLFVMAALIVGSLRSVAADDGGPDPPPFPYAELAALSAAEVPKRILALEHVVVRLRPAHGWAVVGELEPGDVAIAEAATFTYSPWRWNNGWHRGLFEIWLRVVLPQGVNGWIPAETTSLSQGLWARIGTEPYQPLMARWLGAGQSNQVGLRAWPNGPPVAGQTSVTEGPYGVFGRSLDGAWIALRISVLQSAAVWAPVAEVQLLDIGATPSDLPAFVGTETTILPVGETNGRQPRSIAPATEWRWTSDHRIIGVGDDTFWRYDPGTQAEHSISRPHGRYELSPDGRRLAVEVRRPDDREEQYFDDVALVDLNTGGVLRFTNVHYVYPLDFGSYLGSWSSDSQAFLAPRLAMREMEFSVLTVTGERHDLPGIEMGLWDAWRWGSDNRLVHEGGDAIPVVTGRGSDLQTTERPVLSAEEQLSYWPVAQQICMLPPGEYDAPGTGVQAFRVPDTVFGKERERIRDCSWFRAWEIDQERTIIYHVPTGTLLLFQTPSGQITELLPELSPDVLIKQRGTVLPSPSGQRMIFHRGSGQDFLGIPHLFDLSLPQHKQLPLTRGQICGRHWNWSPDEAQFTAEVDLTNDYNSRFGLDGLVVDAGSPRRYYGVSEIRLVNRTGSLLRSVRTLHADRSLIEAKWSQDGRWLALGGHRADECTSGH